MNASKLLLASLLTGGVAITPPPLRGDDIQMRVLPRDSVTASRDGVGWAIRTIGAPTLLSPPDAMTIVIEDSTRMEMDTVLEARVLSETKARLHLRSHMQKSAARTEGSRTYRRPGAAETLRWAIAAGDAPTSLTLGVRAEDPESEVHLLAVRVRPEHELTLEESLSAIADVTLEPDTPFVGLEKTVRLAVHLPAARASQLDGAELQVRVYSADGTEGAPFLGTLTKELLKPTEGRVATIFADVPLPDRRQAPFRAIAGVRTADQRVLSIGECAFGFDRVENAELSRRIAAPHRSIQDFTAFSRNGEVFVTAAIAPLGTRAAWDSDLAPADRIETFMQNLGVFVAFATVLQVPATSGLASGGVTALSFAPDVAGFNVLSFTSSTPGGAETVSVATGVNSVRLAAYFGNPVHVPQAASEEVPNASWRGNAILPYGDGRLMLGVETQADGTARPRALVSRVFSNWIDLGAIPVELPKGTEWLTASPREGDGSIILTGPPAKAWTSADPLRQWTQLPMEIPGDWGKVQYLEANGRKFLFGHAVRFGRGVVEWKRLDIDEHAASTSPATAPRDETRY